MSPSSPVSMGTFPSNRTLLVGEKQFCPLTHRNELSLSTVQPVLNTCMIATGMYIATGLSTG